MASHGSPGGVAFNRLLLLFGGTPGGCWEGPPWFSLARGPRPRSASAFHLPGPLLLVDVHRGVSPPQRGPFKFALYLSLFPQRIAGPIVRYADVAAQIDGRELGVSKVAEGFRRFITGGKKNLLAGTLAPVTEDVFASCL